MASPDPDDARPADEAPDAWPVGTERLVTLLYDELRRMADGYMGAERAGHTLQPTALVHEAFLRLSGQTQEQWESRAHFLAAAARAMRRVLVDHARRRGAVKRPGHGRITLEDGLAVELPATLDVLSLDQALLRLASQDERHAHVVEMRFFGGLAIEEVAEVLGVSPATVKRDWRFAKTWLRHELG